MQEDITRLLIEWRQGSEAAHEALLPLVYDELHRIAARQLSGGRTDHTLQPEDLVFEAWLHLANSAAKVEWQDRTHFLAVASRMMRQILVHHARAHNARKRWFSVPGFFGGKRSAMPVD